MFLLCIEDDIENPFLYGFSQPHFCCFIFKNTPSCSFKYFENSGVIVVKKKSSLKVY